MSKERNETMAGFYSRTALAEKLDMPLKVLTKTLLDAGWIQYLDESWKLTAKGEFEGGEIRHSKRYGDYIVWPSRVCEHAIFADREPGSLSASAIAQKFSIKARQVNALLAEQGLIERDIRGWRLSPFGRQCGGSIHTHEPSGRTYALWEQDFLDRLKPLAAELQDLAAGSVLSEEELAQKHSCVALDGQEHPCRALKLVGDWLYLAGLGHSCGRALPRERSLKSQFYLPDSRLYLEVWGLDLSPQEISAQFQRQEYYEREGSPYVSLSLPDLAHLDELLARQLLERGVESYQHL
ncbi:hypothetical protein [Pseudoteredinibacter isoporae]|uniref:hypothetical protein n=1 Tax=Pseudoteredinibacter isoporae TaxID=570281 RepID=UPI00333F885A